MDDTKPFPQQITYTDPNGTKHVYRKPTDFEYAEFQAAPADRRNAALHAMINACAADTEKSSALLKQLPALVSHDLGIGAQLIKLAGAGLGSFSIG